MSKYAERVYTDQAKIAALEALIKQLPGHVPVKLSLTDGSHLVGSVAVRPTIQTFVDGNDQEGANGQLRVDGLDPSQQPRWIWLDQIVAVEQLQLPE